MIVRIVLFLLIAVFLTVNAWAEKADREKPMLIEADFATIDDKEKVQVLEGNVIITKGTIRLEAARVRIVEDQYGYQKGTAFKYANRRAYFRQKREGVDEYIEGKADRIVYDGNYEVAELIGNAWVKSGKDEVKGAYIRYNAMNETYFVNNGSDEAQKSIRQNPKSARVRAIIQPRNKTDKNNAKVDSKKKSKGALPKNQPILLKPAVELTPSESQTAQMP